jgi:Response regulator containing CheY-like receiver domain and AraC-type DNA-binding domain
MYQIFVVEDELLIRQNIRSIIENMTGPYAFCGEASDGEMALSMMQDLMPDILLTDIKMPFLDGFELIRHVKAMMPWLRIIIISGYGEFESAQKAISLGVDLYLLKPIRSTDLMEAIDKIAEQLEESKTKNEVPPGYDKDELHSALHQHFMQQLFYGSANTSVLLERARALKMDVVQPFYQVVLFYFDTEDAGRRALQATIATVLNDRKTILYHFNGSDQLTLLVYAANRETLNEETYRFVNIVRHELKGLTTVMTTVVGNVVERISAIKDAYGTANAMLKKVHSVSAGQVIDVNDTAQITADIVSFSSPFGEEFQQKLLYASVEDVPALLDEYLNGSNGDQFNSMLFRYYTLVDILKIAVRIVSTAKSTVDPKDIASRFSNEYDIFAASSRRDSFKKLALELLREAVRMKQENLAFLRHSHVISRAEEYVAQNYCDPNISLISVAKHVGMSSAHFSTVFSQTVGRTFISHLTFMRIEKAKELLAHTDMKLSSIAMEIGYNEPNYFSHVFKKTEGITPKEYRGRKTSGGRMSGDSVL